MADTKQFKIVDGPLSVRNTPQGTRTGQYLQVGTTVEVKADSRTEAGNYVWWEHSLGWSAERLVNGEVYMAEVTEQDGATATAFKVVDGPLSIRQAASGTRLPQTLAVGQTIDVDPASRTEKMGYVWWQHSLGWSAERNISGTSVFLEAIRTSEEGSVPAPPQPPVQDPDPEPEPKIETGGLSGQVRMQAATSVKVRSEPSVAPNVTVIRTLTQGETVTANFADVRQANGYYWLQHQDGWSAWKAINGSDVYLVEAGSDPSLIEIGPDGPAVADLPGFQELITQLPVSIDQTQWFQYFGNNVFAFTDGANFNYDGYSQGLHAGLDFGNSIAVGVPVFAGLEAQFLRIERNRPRNFKVYLKHGDYTLIYQHVTNMVNFTPGQTIAPGTRIADIEARSQNGGYDHLHFEIRFRTRWIVNPLALMTPELVSSVVAKFDPEMKMRASSRFAKSGSEWYYFYKTGSWNTWTSPLDQPIIKLAGPVVGPRG